MTVKYFYLRDAKNTNRVATFARILIKEADGKTKLQFAFAITFPARKYFSDGLDVWPELEKGDQFVKKIGRQISSGRLEKRPFEVELANNTLPIIAMLKKVESLSSDDVPSSLKRMAKEWLKDNENKKPCNWKG